MFSVCEKSSCNILAIFPYLQEVEHECRDMNWGTFKATLADALIDHLLPIQVTFGYIITQLFGTTLHTYLVIYIRYCAVTILVKGSRAWKWFLIVNKSWCTNAFFHVNDSFLHWVENMSSNATTDSGSLPRLGTRRSPLIQHIWIRFCQRGLEKQPI